MMLGESAPISSRARRSRRRATVLFFALVFAPMFLVFPYLRQINNPNEYVRVFTVMSLVEQRTFSIDQEVSAFGWVNDMARVKKSDGQFHYYMVKAPGVVYAALPGYWLFSKAAHALGHHFPGPDGTSARSAAWSTGKDGEQERLWWLRWSTWACRASAVQLPCFVFLIWFERFLRAFSRDTSLRLSAVAAAGLGTNYLAYVHMFASHALFAVCSFASFAIALRELWLSRGDSRRRRAWAAFGCAWFASACVMFEYHALFVVVILCLFGLAVFWRPKNFLAFAAGGLVNVPPVMFFHWRAYGNPLTPGHQMLETQQFAVEHKTGLWGVVWPTWEHVTALSFDPGFGLFGTSPFLILGLLAVPAVLFWPRAPSARMRRLLRVATVVWIACMAMLLAVNAGIIEWRAGWSIGPRYQGAAPPFYAFGALTALESIARRGRWSRAVVRGVAGGLGLASVVTIGIMGTVLDTLPLDIERPFAQVALPLVRAGFVPHHLAEWFGWTSTTPYYLVLACLLAAPLVGALYLTQRERFGTYALRLGLVGAFVYLGLLPAFSPPHGAAELLVPGTTPWFMSIWEPAGRDRLTLLRQEAERYGARRPCLWHKLAHLERAVNLAPQAEADERRASALPKGSCPRVLF